MDNSRKNMAEEAIKIISSYEMLSCGCCIQNIFDGEIVDVETALMMAMGALEKQIPKKPYRHESSPSDIYLCCTCGSTFIVRDRIHMNYCNNCGQKILWEEGE